MCEFNKVIEGKKTSCYFSEIDSVKKMELIDNQGFCVFHSKNEEWKNENNFINHLEELIKYFEEEHLQENIFLEDVIFTGDIENIFNIKEFKKNITLKHSQFKEDLIINSSTFKDINFDSVIFNKTVSLLHLSIGEITLNNTCFKSRVSFEDINIKNNFFMLDSNLYGGISILNSIFHSKSFFERLKTNLDNTIRQGITFKNIQFKDFTTFELSEFNSMVDFKKIDAHNELIFHNTQFNYNEPIPIASSVTFNQIHIKEKGRLDIRGSADNKMFNKVQDVSFAKENIEGKLFFENTDFTKFSSLSRERLISATKEKNANVIIGIGCIKYYNQTPLKSIEISDDNQNLAVELCNTFVDYFTNNGGFNLGVEFVNKTKQHINFFYFSDEGIPYEEFEAKLQKAEQQMWRLIKVESDNLSAHPAKNNLPAKIINATDTMVNLFGLVLKIGSRIPLGLISKDEIADLLNTTLPVNSKKINGLIVNQIVLFGIKNNQSFQVKKIG